MGMDCRMGNGMGVSKREGVGDMEGWTLAVWHAAQALNPGTRNHRLQLMFLTHLLSRCGVPTHQECCLPASPRTLLPRLLCPLQVPLMEIKRCTERFLSETSLNYTIIKLCGFMQVHREEEVVGTVRLT